MMRRLLRLLLVGILLAPVASFAQTPIKILPQGPKPGPNLSGTWRDKRGDGIAITQSGSNVTLTATSGRVFRGFQSGNDLTLMATFHGSEMIGAPADVQAKIDAMGLKVYLSGTVDDQGRTITATETRPYDVTWDGAHNVTKEASHYATHVTLTRSRLIEIGTLNPFGYENALAVQKNKLKEEIQDAQGTETLIRKNIAGYQTRFESDSTARAAALQQGAALAGQMRDVLNQLVALQNVAQTVPKPAQALYRQKQTLEKDLARRQQMLESGDGGPGAADTLRAGIVSDLDQLDVLNAKLAPLMPKPPDTSAQQAALQAKYNALDDQALAAEKQAAHATSAMESDEALKQIQFDRLPEQEARISKAQAQIVALDGSLGEVQVYADGQLVYDSVNQPGTTQQLAQLDANLEIMRGHVAVFDTARKQAGDNFFNLQQDALSAGQALESAIRWSSYERAAVDCVFNAIDFTEAFMKGGMIGLATEAGKKLLETAAFQAYDMGGNPWSGANPFKTQSAGNQKDINAYEADIRAQLNAGHTPPEPFIDTLKDVYTDKGTTVAVQRAIKEVTSNVLKAGTNRWLAPTYEKGTVEAVRTQLSQLAAQVGQEAANQSEQAKLLDLLAERLKNLKKGIPNLAKYLEQKGFLTERNFSVGKTRGTKLLESMGKDAAKTALKAGIDANERQHYMDFFAAEWVAQQAWPPYCLASYEYWKALEGDDSTTVCGKAGAGMPGKGYHGNLKERDALAQGYDPMSGFKATKNAPFADDAKVEVKLIVDGSAQAQVGITAGGMETEAGAPYSFTADAKKFSTGPAGKDGYDTVNLVVHASLK